MDPWSWLLGQDFYHLWVHDSILKPGQNKNGQKSFQLHRFLNTFFTAGSWEKVFKKRCSWKLFWPFLFCDGFRTLLHWNLMYNHGPMDLVLLGPWFYMRFCKVEKKKLVYNSGPLSMVHESTQGMKYSVR